MNINAYTVKPVLSGHSKRPKIGFQDRLSLNADQKYCRILQCEHSAILSTFIKCPLVFKTFVLSIFRVATQEIFYCALNTNKSVKQLDLEGESAISLCDMTKDE